MFMFSTFERLFIDDRKKYSYEVRRTKYHNFPIYLETWHVGTAFMSIVKNIEGDIWQLEADLREYLESRYNNDDLPILTSVCEITRSIRVRGKFLEEMADFLQARGM